MYVWGNDWIFQQDNTAAHNAHLMRTSPRRIMLLFWTFLYVSLVYNPLTTFGNRQQIYGSKITALCDDIFTIMGCGLKALISWVLTTLCFLSLAPISFFSCILHFASLLKICFLNTQQYSRSWYRSFHSLLAGLAVIVTTGQEFPAKVLQRICCRKNILAGSTEFCSTFKWAWQSRDHGSKVHCILKNENKNMSSIWWTTFVSSVSLGLCLPKCYVLGRKLNWTRKLTYSSEYRLQST